MRKIGIYGKGGIGDAKRKAQICENRLTGPLPFSIGERTDP